MKTQKVYLSSQENNMRILQWISIIMLVLTLSACGGGSTDSADTTADLGDDVADNNSDDNDNDSGDNGDGTNSLPPPAAGIAENDEEIFAQKVYPILISNEYLCANCHTGQVQPFISHTNVTTAYNAVVGNQKVNLNNPEISRLVVKPRVEFHNCGGNVACEELAVEIQVAIQEWADIAQVANTPSNVERVTSKVASLADAVVGEAQRVEDNLIAKYNFNEGTGDVVNDVSGVGAAMNLNIQGDMQWLEGGGLKNINGKAVATAQTSSKLFDMISEDQDEYTIEAWIIADALNQDEGGISTIAAYQKTDSGSTGLNNFVMGQVTTYLELRNRSETTGNNGQPSLVTNGVDVRDNLMHVVFTTDQTSGRKLYVDGQFYGYMDGAAAGQFNWDTNYGFVIGNEYEDEGGNLWKGTYKLLAIHNRALSEEQVMQNFEAGAGNLSRIAFDVSDVVGQTAKIEMLVSELDSKAYLFAQPTMITDVGGIKVKNIRIAVNNTIPISNQVFRSVNTTVQQSGQQLSPLGAVIPKSLGSEMDVFHLEFERLGSLIGSGDTEVAAQPPALEDLGQQPEIGIRSFSDVNNTMSSLTGIAVTQNTVNASYQELRDQLPASSDILAFSASTQTAIQRLAVSYCGEVVNDNTACDAVFGGNCDLEQVADKAIVADALFDNFVGELDVQPARADFTTEVVNLIDALGCANGCIGEQETTALQASCAAVLASGVVTIN